MLNVAIVTLADRLPDKRKGNTSCIAHSPRCIKGSIIPGTKARGNNRSNLFWFIQSCYFLFDIGLIGFVHS
jgi:hypothetical protein